MRVHQLKRTLLYELGAREELRGRQGERGRRVRVPPDGRGASVALVAAILVDERRGERLGEEQAERRGRGGRGRGRAILEDLHERENVRRREDRRARGRRVGVAERVGRAGGGAVEDRGRAREHDGGVARRRGSARAREQGALVVGAGARQRRGQ